MCKCDVRLEKGRIERVSILCYENEERVGLYDEILNLYTVVLRSLHRNKLSPKYLAVLVAVFGML